MAQVLTESAIPSGNGFGGASYILSTVRKTYNAVLCSKETIPRPTDQGTQTKEHS